MSKSDVRLKITAKVTIKKFHPHQDPKVDEPYEVVEGRPIVLTGDRAREVLDRYGIDR